MLLRLDIVVGHGVGGGQTGGGVGDPGGNGGGGLGVLGLVAGHDVDEEVEDLGAGDGGGDVGLLERAALVLLGVRPAAVGELEDEHLARPGEHDGGLGGDHADVLVGLHDLLDAGEGEVVVLEVGGGLDLAVLLRPEHLQLLLRRRRLLRRRGGGGRVELLRVGGGGGAGGGRRRVRARREADGRAHHRRRRAGFGGIHGCCERSLARV